LNLLIVVWEKLVWKEKTNKRKTQSKAVPAADGRANLLAGLTIP